MDSKYTKQAKDFLEKTKTRLDIEYIGHGYHFEDDEQTRDIYRFTLVRDGRKYTAKFGQSIAHSGTATAPIAYNKNAKTPFAWGETTAPSKSDILGKRQAPTAYDILACLTKYDPGTLEDFCREFGYDIDSKKAERIYVAVCREYKGVCLIWNDKEREELAEIQ